MDKDSKLNLQVTAVIWGIGLVILFLGLIFNRKALWVSVLCIASATLLVASIYALVQTLRHKGTFKKNFLNALMWMTAQFLGNI